MTKQICCPLCKSSLMYGVETIFMNLRFVDTKTGNLKKRVIKRQNLNMDENAYLVCSNKDCDWIEAEMSDWDESVLQLFDACNQDEVTEFKKSLRND